MKKCAKCRVVKEDSQFYLRKSGKDAGHLRPRCKACEREDNRAFAKTRYNSNPKWREKYLEYQKSLRRKRGIKPRGERNQKHGHCRDNKQSSEYSTWKNMHRRCYNPRFKQFKDYGGRGIQVCVRWHRSTPNAFQNFIIDMGRKPSPELTVDRINNDASYMPSNCRWTTRKVQQRHRSRDSFGRYLGKEV